MQRKVLFVVSTDPRTSHRPAEAIRIAAGLRAAGNLGVSLYLAEAAVLALSESVEDLIDEEVYSRYLPTLAQAGQPIYVQHDTPLLARVAGTPLTHQPLDFTALAALAAGSDSVLHF